MTKAEIKIIKEVLQKNRNIKFAYLFGSQVRNKTWFGSDLDVALYFEQEPELLDIGDIVVQLETAVPYTIDLVSLNNLPDKNPKLAFRIIDEGMLLFGDEPLLSHYKKDTFIKYLDFKPILDLFENKLNERIRNKEFGAANK